MYTQIKNLVFIILTSVVLFSLAGCGGDDDDKTEQALKKEEQTKYNELVTPEIEEVVKNGLNANIYRGINPPDITGYYMFNVRCIKSTITGDGYVGSYIDDYKLKFHDQLSLDVKFLGYEVIAGTDRFMTEHIANGSFISGEGDKFSVFFDEKTTYAGESYVSTSLSIFSGELDRNENGEVIGIKNLQYIYYMKDTGGRPNLMPVGSARLFEDTYAEAITKEKFEKLTGYNKSSVAEMSNTLSSVQVFK
jgi:hypothetical protein